LNPYTDIDLLIERIEDFEEKQDGIEKNIDKSNWK
jgi:hypothetical protein